MGRTAVTVDFEYDWGGRRPTIQAITETLPKVLSLLEQNKSKATFFISTETLPETREAILEISNAGHEIASHGHVHMTPYNSFSETELREQIKKSKHLLEDLIGKPVVGFRTPQFRKHNATEKILHELGFLYDSSSVAVSMGGRYEKRQYETGLIPQIPVSSIRSRFPAGIKWINLFGTGTLNPSEDFVVYLHLFDLLDLKSTMQSYGSDIGLKPLLFYMARTQDPKKTLARVIPSSSCLKDWI